ncbi:MAG: hypothetical protein Q9159_005165 [Coniocarpon cinnabarinum]
MASAGDDRDLKSPVIPAEAPPSYERSASPSATAPSTVESEITPASGAPQPDIGYPSGAQSSYNAGAYGSAVSPISMSPQNSGYYQAPPPAQQQLPPQMTHQYSHPGAPPLTHSNSGGYGGYGQEAGQVPTQQEIKTELPAPVPPQQAQQQSFKNVTPMYALSSAAAPVECPTEDGGAYAFMKSINLTADLLNG